MNNTYCLANNLKGFGELFTTLRVMVKEIRNGLAFVITADLHDSGTHLVLDASQLSSIDEVCYTQHKNGLVCF